MNFLILVVQIAGGVVFKLLDLISRLTGGALFFRLEVEGKENIRELKSPLVIAPMHKSYIDHFFYLASSPFYFSARILPMRALTADWLFNVKWYKGGFLLRYGVLLLGGHPGKSSIWGLRRFLRFALRRLKDDKSISLYPEGEIRRKPGICPLKNGAAYLARISGAPILPMAIRGAELLSLRNFFFGKRTITVVFGKPFVANKESGSREITEEIRKRLREIYMVGY